MLEPSLADLFREAVVSTATVQAAAPIDHTAYRHDPVGWARDVLGIPEWTLRWHLTEGYGDHVTDGTPDPLAAALEAIAAGKWTATASGTGTGKTFVCAVLLLWWLACWPDSVVATVATKADQMEKGIWREVGRLWERFQAHFPDAELTTLRIRMQPWRGDAWGAWGITAAPKAGEEASTAVAGLHAEHLLILVDECPGVGPPIMAALVNTATGDHNIIATWGNPDHQADPLAQFGKIPNVECLRISALDHPNVVVGRELIPGAVTRGKVLQRREQYTEEGALFLSRVRGIAPEQSEHALIRLLWCQEAAKRAESIETAPALKTGPRALGVDVAQSENGDKAALAAGIGACLLHVRAFACPNATTLGKDVWRIMQAERVRPEHVGVDSIGVGAATVNHLDEQTDAAMLARVVRCNGGAAALPASAKAPDGSPMDWLPDANRFKNLRAQMYWQLREDLRLGVIGLPRDPELWRELTVVQFTDEQGVVKIESKDDIRKRLGKSPDRADAVVYWNWVRARTRDAAPIPRGADIARPVQEYAGRARQTPAPFTTPRYTGWRPT